MSECLVPLQAAEIAISKVAAFLADDDQLDEVSMVAFDGNVEAALKASLRELV
jgi:hypothetical protein